MTQDAERQLFTLKWPIVQRCIAYHCGHRLRMRPEDIDDITQTAAVVLLRSIARGVETINADWTCRSAIASWRASNERHTLAPLGERLDAVEAKGEATMCVDGVEMTVTDAELDHPELVKLWRDGISTTEAATRLGISRQSAYQQAAKLGGVAFAQPGRKLAVWKFPADTGQVREARSEGRSVDHQHGSKL